MPFFGKREVLGSHKEEWELMRKKGSPDTKGVQKYNTFPRGRVEIENFSARIFLHPDLKVPEIQEVILREFGLSQEIQGLKEIRFISDYSEHYHATDDNKECY